MNRSTAITPRSSSTHISRFHTDVSNPRQRCPVALVLDTSGSMQGAPIAELQRGVDLFISDILADDVARFSVELTVITFGGDVKLAMPFQSFHNAGEVYSPRLTASGATPMGEALELANQEVMRKKASLKATGIGYFQPWIVLLTDGYPTDNWHRAASLIQPAAEAQKLLFMGIGVGEEADPEILRAFCSSGFPPRHLNGTSFRPLFRWLSQTLRSTTRRSTNHSPLPAMQEDDELDDFSIDYHE